MKMKIKDIKSNIDKQALISAIGLMLMSWAALPIVYWLIVRKKRDKKGKGNGNGNENGK